MSVENHLSPEAVAQRERVNALRPRETDFIGRRGYERKYRDPNNAAAGYDWKYRFKPNDGHGKTTREFNEVAEMLKPFQRADVERVGNMPASPALADDAGRSRGRSRVRRAVNRVERGVDGEVWRETPNGWEPTGRWCLSTPQPWAAVPSGGNPDGTMKAWDSETYDPDGHMWAIVDGEQVMVEL